MATVRWAWPDPTGFAPASAGRATGWWTDRPPFCSSGGTPAAPVSRGRQRLKDPGSPEQLRPLSGTTERPEPCRPGWTAAAVGNVAHPSARGRREGAEARGAARQRRGFCAAGQVQPSQRPAAPPAAPPAPATADKAHRKGRLTGSPSWAQPPGPGVRAQPAAPATMPDRQHLPQISRTITTRPGDTNGSPLPERPLAPQMAPWPSCSTPSSQKTFCKTTGPQTSPKPAHRDSLQSTRPRWPVLAGARRNQQSRTQRSPAQAHRTG